MTQDLEELYRIKLKKDAKLCNRRMKVDRDSNPGHRVNYQENKENQIAVMKVLKPNKAMTVHEIAKEANINPSLVDSTIERLLIKKLAVKGPRKNGRAKTFFRYGKWSDV